MIEIFRVLAEGTGVSPRRFAVSPLRRSLRYQLVWNGRASQSAFIRVTRSSIRGLLAPWVSSWPAGPPARFRLLEAGAPVDERQVARAATALLVGLRLVDLERGGIAHPAPVPARPPGRGGPPPPPPAP